ncbi:flagellar biosynthesis protein FlgF [Paraburkholderia acidicola]|uniref:Flagellar hook protein FlgE n=1 Tax=Paraburkholderia acidicola TaxID=1912599 RepID=A0A2A4ESS7_9BURK|nr:flagellar hook-basal body complex protein [Paraburkholderia acidicola]PCE23737.1 flagellar biosynthesis protein FlgF [Paraburkholderia acidicola]
MLDTIHIAMSGLNGYEKGLRVISNDTANLNTPGFKGSSLQFADMFYSDGQPMGDGQNREQYGYGLDTLGTVLNFQQGQLQTTGNDLDLAVDGSGLFMMRDGSGAIHGSRDGRLKFTNDGTLVSSTTNEQVMARDGHGNLVSVNIGGMRTSPAGATTTIALSGNLSSSVNSQTVGGITVIDRTGTAHALSLKFDAQSGTAGAWAITLLDGTRTVGTGKMTFANGRPDASSNRVTVAYTPDGQPSIPLQLDFSTDVTSYDSGTQTTLTMKSQDGYGPGNLSRATFDASGTLQLAYSNGQTTHGPRLALGQFNSQDAIRPVGNNEFETTGGQTWQIGVAGEQGLGSLRSGTVEISNVDLSQEFSNLVIMQRGYQASSQIVSTASDMLNQLFQMQSK